MNSARLEFSESEVLQLLNEAQRLLESIVSDGPQEPGEITASNYLEAAMQLDSIRRLLSLLILQASRDRDERPDELALISPENLDRFDALIAGIQSYTETLRLRFEVAPEAVN